MLSVISFSLIPEGLKLSSNIFVVIIGIILGIFLMLIIKKFFDNSSKLNLNIKSSNIEFLKTGLIICIGIAIHNIPEGLAIGAGFDNSNKLGLSIAIAICLHDIPEGVSMALPMKIANIKNYKILVYVFLSGMCTMVGTIIGYLLGTISSNVIAFCLSFSAGAMLYIVSGELIPEYNKLYSGTVSAISNIFGFLIGLLGLLII